MKTSRAKGETFMRGFKEALEKFITSADWLGDEDEIVIVSLRAMAEELDEATKINPPLMAQFGLAYRNLQKKKPEGPKEEDPFSNVDLLRRGI